MLHNYATRDQQRIEGVRSVDRGRGSYEGGGLATRRGTSQSRSGWRAGVGTEEEKNRLVEEKFFGGWLDRPTDRPTTRLMNRNNSRAIVLFGSFQLTVAHPSSSSSSSSSSSPTSPSTPSFSRSFCAILRSALSRILFREWTSCKFLNGSNARDSYRVITAYFSPPPPLFSGFGAGHRAIVSARRFSVLLHSLVQDKQFSQLFDNFYMSIRGKIRGYDLVYARGSACKSPGH